MIKMRLVGGLSVRTKILAIAATGGVVAAAVGVTGLVALSSSSAAAQSIYRHHLDEAAAVGTIRAALLQVRLDVANHAISRDAARTKYRDAYGTDRQRVDAAIRAYSDGDPSGDPAVTAELEQIWRRYTTIAQRQLLPAREKHDVEPWEFVRDTQIVPLMQKAIGDLDKLNAAESGAAAAAAESARREYEQSRLISLVLLTVGLLCGLVVGWLGQLRHRPVAVPGPARPRRQAHG